MNDGHEGFMDLCVPFPMKPQGTSHFPLIFVINWGFKMNLSRTGGKSVLLGTQAAQSLITVLDPSLS